MNRYVVHTGKYMVLLENEFKGELDVRKTDVQS